MLLTAYGCLVTSRKIINPNAYFSEWFLFRKGFFSEFSDKKPFGIKTVRKNNLSEQKLFGIKTVRNKTFRRNDTSEYRPAPDGTVLPCSAIIWFMLWWVCLEPVTMCRIITWLSDVITVSAYNNFM